MTTRKDVRAGRGGPVGTPLLTLGLLGLLAPGCYSGLSEGPDGAMDPSGADGDDEDGDDGDGDDGVPGHDDDDDDDDGPNACTTVGLAQMRELTGREYDRTVQELLGTDATPSTTFVSDARLGPFADNSGRGVVETIAVQYQRAAENLAAAQDIASIVPCTIADANADDTVAASCAEAFVEQFGARAYRQPITADQRDALLALYDEVRTDPDVQADFTAAIRTVLEAILQSPYFLHHIQWGDPDAADEAGRIPLTDWELASRLSYFVWDAPPDDVLWDAAFDGQLTDPDALEAQVRRMLDDPRARDTLALFFDDWLDADAILHTDKVDAIFPEYDEALQQSMRESLRLFLTEVVLDDPDADLENLLTADVVFADARMAEIYGLDGVPTDGTFARIEDPPHERIGVLGQAAFLAGHAASWESSPLFRGLFVYDRLMCGLVAPPPDEIEFPEPIPGETPLELAERHMSEPSCNGCHGAFDPVGLGMERYDSLGRYRLEYGPGQPASNAGRIETGLEPELLGPFEGTTGLADRLLSSGVVHRCVSRQAMRFAVGAAAEGGCIVNDVGDEWQAEGGTFRELMVSVVRSEGFRFRLKEQAQ